MKKRFKAVIFIFLILVIALISIYFLIYYKTLFSPPVNFEINDITSPEKFRNYFDDYNFVEENERINVFSSES